jgi:glycosyltransferase involved in cell wall biosynthesis
MINDVSSKIDADTGSLGDRRVGGRGSVRLAIFVSHPIQYYAPMWRGLARTPGLEPVVHFFSDVSVRGGRDAGFGVDVQWDIPLLEGYAHRFLARDGDPARAWSMRMSRAKRLLREGRFDAVMVHGYTRPFERQVVVAGRRLGIRVVQRGEFTDTVPLEGRGRLKSLFRDLYLRWFYSHISAFCYIGEEARAHLRRMGVGDDRMFFSPYSVDTELFEAQRGSFDRAEERRRLGIGDRDVAVLFSGKLIPRKAPLLLIDALARIEERERVWLILLGDGELRHEVERRGREVFGDRLIVPGFVNQSQVGRFFVASDVFSLPSRFETWGLVVNEAMQFALPVVVGSKVLSHRDLVAPGITGFVHEDGDAVGLAAHLEALVGDPELRARMGRAAREHVARYDTAASVRGIVRALGLA